MALELSQQGINKPQQSTSRITRTLGLNDSVARLPEGNRAEFLCEHGASGQTALCEWFICFPVHCGSLGVPPAGAGVL